MSVAIMLIISMTVVTNLFEGNVYGSQKLEYEEKMLGLNSSQEFNLNDLFVDSSSKPIIDIQNIPVDDSFPDIYYIIMDEYASYHGLKEFFDYNNNDFINYLRLNGFFVNEISFANKLNVVAQLYSGKGNEISLDELHDKAVYLFNKQKPFN